MTPEEKQLAYLLNTIGGNFENNLESEHADAVETAKILSKLPPAHKRMLLTAVAEKNGVVKHIGSGDNRQEIYSLIANSKGDLNITVTRVSANIPLPLPFVLFGSNDFADGYASTLRTLTGRLNPGTTVAVSTSATGDIVFTYVDVNAGGATDTVTVSNLGNITMKNFLAGMNNNYFSTMLFLCSISDETKSLLQYKEVLFFGELSSLGMAKANQLVFRSRIFSFSFRKDVVEVVLPEQKITPDFSFGMSIIPVVGFTMGFDYFMSQRKNLNDSVR